jgi:hypothetical protein
MRIVVAAAVAVIAVLCAGCARDQSPDSMFDDAGYHVRGSSVYFLNPFPGNAFSIDGADPGSFEALDRMYARDSRRVYLDGRPLPDADPGTFEVLGRPGLARDGQRVYQRDQVISADPGGFELLPGGLSRDGGHVYWSDGTVLSDDPKHFAILSDGKDYLYATDSRAVYVNGNVVTGAAPRGFRVLDGAYAVDGDGAGDGAFYFDAPILGADASTLRTLGGPYAVDAQRVYWMGQVIDGADPASFTVLNANFECSADRGHAYHRQSVIADADPSSFPAGRPVTGCSGTSLSFG